MSVTIRFEPDGQHIAVKHGMSVLDASRKARVSIRTRCQGKAGCLLCKVDIQSDTSSIAPPTDAEQRKLGITSTYGQRLACQARIIPESNGEVVVRVPEDPLKAAVRKRLAEQQEDDRLW